VKHLPLGQQASMIERGRAVEKAAREIRRAARAIRSRGREDPPQIGLQGEQADERQQWYSESVEVLSPRRSKGASKRRSAAAASPFSARRGQGREKKSPFFHGRRGSLGGRRSRTRRKPARRRKLPLNSHVAGKKLNRKVASAGRFVRAAREEKNHATAALAANCETAKALSGALRAAKSTRR